KHQMAWGNVPSLGVRDLGSEQEFVAALCDIVARTTLQLTDTPEKIKCLGLKYTNIRNEFDLIQKHTPGARLLVMFRDPRDIFASQKHRLLHRPVDVAMSVLIDMLNQHQYVERRQP